MHKHKGEYEEAFGKFCEANEIRMGEAGSLPKEFEQKYKAGIENLRNWTPKNTGADSNSLTKLLFLAPSRSGKSTLEHLLNKSSQVLPLYEANKFKHLKASAAVKFEDIFYQNERKLLEDGYKIVTSAAPSAIFALDRLMDVLHNTFCIIIKRDYHDVASEIFTSEYKKENFHSYDASHVTKYLNAYYKMCEIVKDKIPDRVITISYDELLKEPEKILESIGVLVSQELKVTNIRQKLIQYEPQALFRNHFVQLLANG